MFSDGSLDFLPVGEKRMAGLGGADPAAEGKAARAGGDCFSHSQGASPGLPRFSLLRLEGGAPREKSLPPSLREGGGSAGSSLVVLT